MRIRPSPWKLRAHVSVENLPTPDGAERHDVQIHLPGILKVLGEALYSKPEVAVRELIQNAHDSIVRRKHELAEEKYAPRIVVSAFARLGELWIEDNGSGLTRDEIHTFLATVGRGYTAKLREELAAAGAARATELIGQFGLGLLAAFLIAEEIAVDTRSAATGEAFVWRSEGGATYSLEPGDREEAGTSVRLKIKALRREVLDERFLHTIIQTWADFIPVPIYLGSRTEPENAVDAPWHRRGATRQDYQDFLTRRYAKVNFLEILPLDDMTVQGEDGSEYPVRGVLAIPDTSSVSVREFGEVTVYVRRMMVEERCKDLLPPWARFVVGVVESAAFQPTASRESVGRDESFDRISEQLGQRVLEALNTLAGEDPERFRELVGVHNDLIKSWAIECPEIMPHVENLVLFQTSSGPATLPEIRVTLEKLRRSGALKPIDGRLPIYYVGDRMRSVQARLVLEGRGVPVIDAAHGWEKLFLESYADRHDEIVTLVQVRAGDHTVFQEPPEGTGYYTALVEACADAGIRAEASVYEPKEIPALLVFNESEEEVLDARRMVDRLDVFGRMRRVVEAVANSWSGEGERPGTLMLNTAHPLVQDLASLEANDVAAGLIVRLLYDHAALLEQRSIGREGMLQLFEEAANTLRFFLDDADKA
jgi:molecular chaperone HtpG